ncbi:hypothetical protein Q428_09250 [Fervidicella metallireducens AeB]|uniref:LysM domain-containing protein n=1 Tax=Fervidicella metallireducens AeB TaxID=1403537 RepID=A0A017RU54_9CLOT|nr:LysM peptidoglycan-binding domain-containing protein [Fervidicella metallireducens]EYE88207.1 hypothetical protein Q428_09250 [Fervidicella metallireducens AeB]
MRESKFKKIFIIISLIFVLVLPFSLKASGNANNNCIKVTVNQGDTLWKIAKEHKRENEDVRKLIYEIRKINKLDSAVIVPGQTLLIPQK